MTTPPTVPSARHSIDRDRPVRRLHELGEIGAIPGTTGCARLALTAAHELRERGQRRALCTMCVGVGQGVALGLEAV